MRHTDLAGATVREKRVVASQSYFRLNPAENRHVYHAELSGSALVGQTAVELGHEIIVEGTLRCGLETRVACEVSSFRGVAAILSISDEDSVVAELVLLHKDPSLNLPLARSDDMEDLAADWQMWAKRYNLPLILIEPDGAEQMISNRVGALDVADTKPRRPNMLFSRRRPRFLTRRKTGTLSSENQISGHEIIARN